MKKKVIIGSIITLIIVLGIVLFIILNNNKKEDNSDALRFKESYEALNGQIREGSSNKYHDITISEDNPIKYINCKEAIDLLDEDEAIIYVGAEWCPWCRNAVPVMLDVAKNKNIKTIYYLNLDDEKSQFEVIDKKVTETKHGSDDYYKLLDKLKDILRDYTITDSDNNTYNTNEKRIYNPTIFAIKNKKVVDNHIGTVTLNEGQTSYDELTKDQYNELYNIYDEMFSKVYNNTCDNGEICE